MARTVGIGIQDFSKIRENDIFYIDKTSFIKEWWESFDSTTLISRPRRFGKTLNMSMLECFFSVDYVDRGDLCIFSCDEIALPEIWKSDDRKWKSSYESLLT